MRLSKMFIWKLQKYHSCFFAVQSFLGVLKSAQLNHDHKKR